MEHRPEMSGKELLKLLDATHKLTTTQGLSGRTLRRLPFSAIALHTYTETCTLSEALTALEVAISDLQQGVTQRILGI